MGFIDELRSFSAKAQSIRERLLTEEATKVSLIMPFLQLLGYNVFDPSEVEPEYAASVPGIKKDERVDYAIFIGGELAIIIEAKGVNDPLTSPLHNTQLFRYFSATPAKFAVISNGLQYKFYSDIQETNKMDDSPFLEFNLLDIKETAVAELEKFKKDKFNADELADNAAILKYTDRLKKSFSEELKEPKDDFVRYFLRDIYSSKLTEKVIERFRPLVAQALNQHISDIIHSKIKAVLETSTPTKEQKTAETPDIPVVDETAPKKDVVVTTGIEIEAFYLIKNMLRDVIDSSRITYKDTIPYFAVLLDGMVTRWLCRLYLCDADDEKKNKYIQFPEGDKIPIKTIDDIYAHKSLFVAAIDSRTKAKDAQQSVSGT